MLPNDTVCKGVLASVEIRIESRYLASTQRNSTVVKLVVLEVAKNSGESTLYYSCIHEYDR